MTIQKVRRDKNISTLNARFIGQFSLTFFLLFCMVSSTLAQGIRNTTQKTSVSNEQALPIEQAPTVSTTYKQLAGEASEISTMSLPNTATLGISSQAALIPVEAHSLKDGVQTIKFPVEKTANLRLVLIAPNSENWGLNITLPENSTEFDLRQDTNLFETNNEKSSIGLTDEKFPAEIFSISDIESGYVSLKIDTGMGSADKKALSERKHPLGYLAVSAEGSSYGLYSYVTNTEMIKGEKVYINANIYIEDETQQLEAGQQAMPVNNSVRQLNAKVQTPGGTTTTVTMYDNGLNNDGVANDGLYGANFTPTAAGEYTIQVNADAMTQDSEDFIRSSEHIIAVNDKRFSVLSGTTVKYVDEYRSKILMPVSNAVLGQLVNAQAEVWGRENGGKFVAVNWIGGVAAVEKNASGALSVPMILDQRWLANSSATGNYELRNIRIQNPDNYGIIGSNSKVTLPTLMFPFNLSNFSGQITDDMRMGVKPVDENNNTENAVGGKLMLVHGYCSGDVWKTGQDRGDFANSIKFTDFNKNRSHDTFARMIRDFGAPQPSFGVVAHSQGGAAALHLYAKYWSKMDYATGGSRLIQSVGTPYQGTSLAGILALIARIFGVSCGANFNLTHLGAALWLQTIPQWARSKVYYHTTSFNDVWYRYDYCSLATDLFLRDPDDGVIEKGRGQLYGANNLGHKTGWCHSSNMRDPAQTTDRTRNLNMSANAAR